MCVVYIYHEETQESEREKLFPAVNIVKMYIKAVPRAVVVVVHTLSKEKGIKIILHSLESS